VRAPGQRSRSLREDDEKRTEMRRCLALTRPPIDRSGADGTSPGRDSREPASSCHDGDGAEGPHCQRFEPAGQGLLKRRPSSSVATAGTKPPRNISKLPNDHQRASM